MNWIGKIFLCWYIIFTAGSSYILADDKAVLEIAKGAPQSESLNSACQVAEEDAGVKSHPVHVRVLLQEYDLHNPVCFKVISASGFYLIDTTAKIKTAYAVKEIIIKYVKGDFYFNGKQINKSSFYIKPLQGYFTFEGKSYQGSFLITADKKSVYVINSLDIEDYVCAVLRTESWPGWPLEVNKAFAISSRSYVIGIVLNQITSKLPYHIKNTNQHQTYAGIHNDPVLKAAVEQTRGVYLTYLGKPIVAMFDACCGGVIPGLMQGVNFAHAPYLARNYACRFCTNARGYNWKVTYTFDQFEKIVQPEFKKVKKIKEVKNYKIDKAGTVQSIQIKTAQHTFHIPMKKLYYLLPKVRSFYFDVETDKGKITFTGHGIGHHLGLCQWGAREMVARGYTYKQILDFYYPGTQFMRLA